MVDQIQPIGSHLCSLNLFREADGSIHLTVASMDPRLIETTGGEVPERMAIIASWVDAGLERFVAAWGMATPADQPVQSTTLD